MSTEQRLLSERLIAAAEEKADNVEDVCGSKEEKQRKQQLDTALTPRIVLVRGNVHIPSLSPGAGLKQDNTETPQIKEEIKEEPEEQSIKQEEEQLPLSDLNSTAVCVKKEESSSLEQGQTENQEETQGETISSEPLLHSETEEETDDDDDWEPPFSFTTVTVNNEDESGAEEDTELEKRKSSGSKRKCGRKQKSQRHRKVLIASNGDICFKKRKDLVAKVPSAAPALAVPKPNPVVPILPHSANASCGDIAALMAEGLEGQEWSDLGNCIVTEVDFLPGSISPEYPSTPSMTFMSAPASEDLNDVMCEFEESTPGPLSEATQRPPLREGCGSKCRRRCSEKFSEERRRELWEQYWKLTYAEKRSFIFHTVEKGPTARTNIVGEKSRRARSLMYKLTDDHHVTQRVCKVFYLSTLGYHPHNDSLIFSVIGNDLSKLLAPKQDQRGKHAPFNKLDDSLMDEHIESFHPVIIHDRRAQASKRRYLPSDITVRLMHNDFLDKGKTGSYETYRRVVKKKNISFAKLLEEQCEDCMLHDEHMKEEHAQDICESCQQWQQHIDAANESQAEYRSDAEMHVPADTSIRSVDMQKVIMLPRMPGVKSAVLTRRLTTYHETFATLGRVQEIKHLSVVWHDGIAGRSNKEITSAYFAALQRERDAKHIVYWVDNCSTQNKNWCLLSSLVCIVNSDTIAAEDITIKYLESGHTFMSADRVHHGVELEMKNRPGEGVYDFEDFLSVVRKSNSKKVTVVELTNEGVLDWTDGHSKVKTMPKLADIKAVQLRRGSRCMFTKSSHGEKEFRECDFLQDTFPLQIPTTFRSEDKGVEESMKNDIVKTLCPLMPSTRRPFWCSLSVTTSQEE